MKYFEITVEETNMVVYTVLADSEENAIELLKTDGSDYAGEIIDSNIENIVDVTERK